MEGPGIDLHRPLNGEREESGTPREDIFLSLLDHLFLFIGIVAVVHRFLRALI
jgi:hypothetical protein